MKLFIEGSDRLEKEFDLSKIIVKLRNLNVFAKNKLINKVMKVELQNCNKTVIDIDSEEENKNDNNLTPTEA